MKKRYDSYKPSGIDWIGDIPSHWVSKRLRYVCEFRNGYTPSKANGDYWSEGTIPWYRMEDIRESGRFLKESKQYVSTEAVKGGGLFEAGSFILATTATIGEHAMLIVDSQANQRFTNLKIRKSLSHTVTKEFFFYYLFVIDEFCKSTTKTTTFPAMDMTDLRNLGVSIPPLAEQEAIAAWLDEKCGEIDAAIAKVDREIELIDELKQSEISRVVTRGLNPDTPLRPSGIDWIGDVPEHWFNTRIKFNILRSAAGVWGDDEKGDENDIVCFRIADFDYDERCLSTEKITIRNIESKQLEGRYLSKGDLLIEKSGGGESTPVGRVVYCNYNGKATYTNFIHSITLSDSVDSRFFLYYFNMLYSNKINLLFFNQTTGLQNLQVSDYLGQSICLPPLSEQQAIADYLDKKCAEIDGLKAKLSKKRETLTELRQSIISEVVTGKRKVI